MRKIDILEVIVFTIAMFTVACSRAGTNSAESCMTCHNGSNANDFAGPGLENPHPFDGAAQLLCTTCHGGDPNGVDAVASHVPPPPEIGDDALQANNAVAYFNRLTLTGIDKFDDYTVDGKTYKALDYLQFINPGDLRVVTDSRSCGKCHTGHAECVDGSLLATEAGVFSGAMFAIGVDNEIPANQGLFENTAADLAFRAVTDTDFTTDPAAVGVVGELIEMPVFSGFGDTGVDAIHNNPVYDSTTLQNGLLANNQVQTGSPLANVYNEQVAFTCGDCHLGSAGANNRYGDFRSSGCTACHMQYSLDGRSRSGDPNVNLLEPADPDDIEAPEQPHIARHLLTSVAMTLPSGEAVQGINDYACAGCHQGSNRTVMQYWGIRLDQNEDVRRGKQYPADPVTFQNTANDPRLFDPAVGNQTFNGRRANQYLLKEDYDGDGRDDTPADVHYDAGMGCIDCHGSSDLHGGYIPGATSATIMSRQEQGVAIECESCHGTIDAYALTMSGTDITGKAAEIGMDRQGNPISHVVKEGGDFFMYSKLTGAKHYVSQTLDTVSDNGKTNPFSGVPVYTDRASFAMGRDDGNSSTGIGPQQTGGAAGGFAHTDSMSCASCHSSWTNSCIGCHLGGEYNDNNKNLVSNITGERIVFDQANADFVYQTPVPFQLGIGPKNRIEPIIANTDVFFQYRDLNENDSQIFKFSDRNGAGNDPVTGLASLSHNVMMPHSIRGRVSAQDEGPRYCVACHLTDESLSNFGAEYTNHRAALGPGGNLANLDFNLLQTHIGKNTGNQLNSPIWVHMVAGLGTGLYLFDEHGCPVNPLDDDDNRVGCDGTSPKDNFDINNAVFDLDRLVDTNGDSKGSSNHAMLDPVVAPNLRDGAVNPQLSGPLGATLIERLADPTTGIVLNAWLDADGATQGDADDFVSTDP
ncbi:MAG: hypothetical protein ACI8TQ_001466 [Planctomycetota bacterium]|jgi:hypothetical protein